MGDAAGPVDRSVIKISLENERRDIKDLWNDALRAYNGILGEELKPVFPNVAAMIQSANQEMENFHHWRHDEAMVDKLRTLFMSSIGLVQTGTQMLIAAATPAFPPAAAIGTAITFVLAACKSVSADYNVVAAFFDDMNSFLQRVSILEARLPAYKAYQACLMDVFTSLLKMCAFAQKFIRLGRFQKWVINAFKGDDSELAGSRKNMDKALTRLESATEFAILANTDDLKGSQQVLQSMQRELQHNQKKQTDIQESQQAMLQTMLDGQVDVKDDIGDIKKLLEALQRTNADQRKSDEEKDARSIINAVRAVIDDIPENKIQLQRIQDDHIQGTCEWIFEESIWKTWYNTKTANNGSPLLLIKGSDGVGKSHLAAVIYDRIERDISKDPSGLSCAAYFFSHESVATLKHFQSVINSIILQISDKNTILRSRINAILQAGRKREEKYVDDIIGPLFSLASQIYLYIVIDALDALETDWDRDSIFDMVDKIRQDNLRIKVVATMRANVEPADSKKPGRRDWTSNNEIIITKNKILPDIRALIQDRLHTLDSAFRGIRYLQPATKSEVSTTLADNADGLLYVEQGLLYLTALGREVSIKKFLQTAMPTDVTGWFQYIVERCGRRTPSDLLVPVQSLITWLVFSFETLNLDGINRLIRIEANNPDLELEDAIMDVYNVFLQLQSTGTYIRKTTEATLLTAISESASAHEDGSTQLMFRKRSMREFFLRQQAATKDLSTSTAASYGHRQMFLLCCRIIDMQRTSSEAEKALEGFSELHYYALMCCLRHWHNVSPRLHDLEENVAVYEAFWKLVNLREGFPSQIEAKGVSIDRLFVFYKNAPHTNWDEVFFEHWNKWSKWLQDTAINPHAQQLRSRMMAGATEYWTQGHLCALTPLAKAHINNWLTSVNADRAKFAYSFARDTLLKTEMRKLVSTEISGYGFDSSGDSAGFQDSEVGVDRLYSEILRLRDLAGSNVSSNSHFATAAVMRLYDEEVALIAVQEMKKAVDKCSSSADKFRYYVYMAKIYRYSNTDDALKYLDLAFQLRDQVSRTELLLALEQKLSIVHPKEIDDASVIYREIRSLDTENLVTDSVVRSRFFTLMRSGDWSALMRLLLDLDLPKQLKIGLDYFHWLQRPYEGLHPALFKAAVVVSQIDDLVRIYTSFVASLDTSNMGSIFAPHLAQLHWRWYADTTAAKTVLTKALESSCATQQYPVVDVDSGPIVVRSVNMLSDILFEQFQRSSDLDTKATLLKEESRGLFERNLPQSVQISDIMKIPHLLVLVNMTQKVDTAYEYEKLLRQAFDIVWASLNDSITSNDYDGVRYLSRILALVPGFEHESEILNSAQLYSLTDQSLFAAFCKNRSLTVDATVAANFEEYVEKQLIDEVIGRKESLSVDFQTLLDPYKEYYDLIPGGFYLYTMMLLANLTEGWTLQQPFCTRLTFCTSISNVTNLACNCWSWEDGAWYTCIYCTESIICQSDYDVRMRWNSEGKPDIQSSFCCTNGKYIKSPAQGWLGIRRGSIYLEGQNPIKFNDFLQQIRNRWNDHWDRVWLG